jgi:hypothetical protein
MPRAIKVFKIFVLGLLSLPMAVGMGSSVVSASSAKIEILHVEGDIVTVVADYRAKHTRRASRFHREDSSENHEC